MEDGSNINEEDQQMMTMMMVSSTGKQLPFSSSPSASSPRHRHQLFPAAAALRPNSYEAEEEEEEEEAGHGGQRESNAVIEKEHMFDKVVTPSDVGKLNRLVIPKQHAEKYFPLDSSTNEKGLLLNFEDRNGKPWRFRYSYWNSSQSYVMTKGWSRFVKEKKLDAGDTVSFQRGVGEFGRDRLFIDWRSRPDGPGHAISSFSSSSSSLYHHHHQHQYQYQYPFSSNSNPFPWNNSSTSASILMRPPTPVLPRDVNQLYCSSNPSPCRNIAYNNRPVTGTTTGGAGLYGYNGGYGNYTCIYNSPISPPNNSVSSVFYMRPVSAVGSQWRRRQQQQQQDFGGDGVVGGSGGVVVEPVVYESLPVVQGKAAAKRLRLFGVNMDCPITTAPNSDSEENLSLTSSTTTTTNTTTSGRTLTVEAPHPPSQQQQYPFQLRLYNGTQLPSSAPHFIHEEGKSSSSSMSLDLELSDGPMSRTSN